MVITLQWLEAEILRLTHLRDRASEKGRKKEYPLYNHTITLDMYLNLLQLVVGLYLNLKFSVKSFKGLGGRGGV